MFSANLIKVLHYHGGHGGRYVEDCQACIAKAAWNFNRGIDDFEVRQFLSKLSVKYRDENIAEFNHLFQEKGYFIEPIESEVVD